MPETLAFPVRAQPASERSKAEPFRERVPAEYTDAEIAQLKKLRPMLDAADLKVVSEALNSILVMHEIKLYFEGAEFRVVEGPEPEPLQTSFISPEGTTRLPIPQAVRDRALARTSDPWTSKAAAASLSAEELRATQEAVLACFRQFGSMHHEKLLEVYEEHRGRLGWPQQAESGLRTRTKELVDGGLLQNSGRTVLLASKRKSIVWKLTPQEEAAAT